MKKVIGLPSRVASDRELFEAIDAFFHGVNSASKYGVNSASKYARFKDDMSAALAAAERVRAEEVEEARSARPWGCFECGSECGIPVEPDCVLDLGTSQECLLATELAREGKGKTDCPQWQQYDPPKREG